MILSGWGRYPRLDCTRFVLHNVDEAARIVRESQSLIARGNGRAYGDAALNAAGVLDMRRCDRILEFDPATGRIACEAGLLLADLLDFAVPRGWFPPVTPGTKFVTIGGMIAADVHGKNHHHSGSFGRHVESLDLLTADGTTRRCSAEEDGELFRATCGGMGLTGLILEARFRLVPIETSYIRQETLRTANLDETLAAHEDAASWTYSVGWIDCLAEGAALGRGVVFRGEHASRVEAPAGAVRRRPARTVPLDLPGWVLNRWSVRAFNELYYRSARPGMALIGYDQCFYPLDALLEWNRLYGRAGFLQYQCVLPKAGSRAALAAILERTAAAGQGSFLAVLKCFGPGGAGFLSFPMEGFTLTLDFPAGRSALALLRALDAVVDSAGGRLYLAKDACTSPESLRRGYPLLERFLAVRAAFDPGRKFASLQSLRLGL
jgi:decaprenylphospho-beta-D-ribofuranose 2-oxidase